MRSVPHMAALHRKMVKHIPSQADMHDFSVSTVKDHINLGCLATVIGNSTTSQADMHDFSVSTVKDHINLGCLATVIGNFTITDLKLHIQIQQMKV